jgi:hypothetical protein
MRPFVLEIKAGDFAFAAGHRAISFTDGAWNLDGEQPFTTQMQSRHCKRSRGTRFDLPNLRGVVRDETFWKT